jgi:hypothetical protein
MAKGIKVLSGPPFMGVGVFEPSFRGLDFSKELDVKLPGKAWAINVPSWDLEERGVCGVGGPGGKPLYHPGNAIRKLTLACKTYDQWRPYPAEEPLSNYAREMAMRIARKRGRAMTTISSSFPWDFIIMHDHSAASLAHLDRDEACRVAMVAIEASMAVAAEWPDAALVIMSPYGVGNEPGFVVSNRMEPSFIGNWEKVRRYATGERIDATGPRPS